MVRVFFDVDNTILCSNSTEWVLRPGTRELMTELKQRGYDIYMWSATGLPHCLKVINRFDLKHFVIECFDKDPKNRILPDMIIDDDWFLVCKYDGICVTPYREPDPDDRELFRALEEIEFEWPVECVP